MIRRRFVWRRESGPVAFTVESRDRRRWIVKDGSEEIVADLARLPDGRASIVFPTGRQLTGRAISGGHGRVEAWVGSRRIDLALSDPLRTRASEPDASGGGAREIHARIPGRVIEVRVAAGEQVAAGETLLVLEAMKMQNEIRSDFAGRVTTVECAPGQAVETGALLVRVEADPVA